VKKTKKQKRVLFFMKKINLLPNMITAFALACGLFVIFKVNMVEMGASYYDLMKTSAFLLLLAAFADFLDGAVARALGAETKFGVIFDSMSDAISFGVAPSVLMLKSLTLEQGTWPSFLAITGAMIFSLCGVLRLVRFNIKTAEAQGNILEMAEQKKHFTGLPIPASAAAAVAANLLFFAPFLQLQEIPEVTRALILTGVMIVLGYLMVSRWKFPSLKALHFRIPSFYLAFLTVLLAIFILYGALLYFPILLAAASWGYVLIGLVLAMIRTIAGKKSKTLEEYEPEEDENENE
jgi:CDP-diacylglycerol---serine O-phosphatidyltransferase